MGEAPINTLSDPIIVQIGQEWIWRDPESGELLSADNPSLEDGAVCDERGIGGRPGFQALESAFAALERNQRITRA